MDDNATTTDTVAQAVRSDAEASSTATRRLEDMIAWGIHRAKLAAEDEDWEAVAILMAKGSEMATTLVRRAEQRAARP